MLQKEKKKFLEFLSENCLAETYTFIQNVWSKAKVWSLLGKIYDACNLNKEKRLF